MSEMVERVAKALLRAEFNETPEDEGFWKKYADTYRQQARAAISAMRQPTEAMGIAGKYATWAGNEGFSDDHAKMTFRAMIDAALK